MDKQANGFNCDFVFCIDASQVNGVKDLLLAFPRTFSNYMRDYERPEFSYRIKFILFGRSGKRYFLEESPFFAFDDEQGKYETYILSLKPTGDRREDKNGLQALAHALHVDWLRDHPARRHFTILLTESGLIPLEELSKKADYPAADPKTFMELKEMMVREVDKHAQRLILFLPEEEDLELYEKIGYESMVVPVGDYRLKDVSTESLAMFVARMI